LITAREADKLLADQLLFESLVAQETALQEQMQALEWEANDLWAQGWAADDEGNHDEAQEFYRQSDAKWTERWTFEEQFYAVQNDLHPIRVRNEQRDAAASDALRSAEAAERAAAQAELVTAKEGEVAALMA